MNITDVIDKYYLPESDSKRILLTHSRSVANKALWIAHRHPELKMDETLLWDGAMAHDVGIYLTNAPEIGCFGSFPYVCHGYLGADLLRKEGLSPLLARICERHTGAGLSETEIVTKALPLPHRDLLPVSLEEQVICFSDKFFSKTHLGEEKSIEKARKSLAKYGEEGVARFDSWCELFL
ncbi:MAG: HDIG domain-containing protein [Prevotellaceae bacterium]|jgi:uncharacterized protein|nr:HDIG domain-containing protein [Prevotellaceae bacterium]